MTDAGLQGPAVFGDRDYSIYQSLIERIGKDRGDGTTALPVRDVYRCFCAYQFEVFSQRFLRLVSDAGADRITCPAADAVGCLFAVAVALWGRHHLPLFKIQRIRRADRHACTASRAPPGIPDLAFQIEITFCCQSPHSQVYLLANGRALAAAMRVNSDAIRGTASIPKHFAKSSMIGFIIALCSSVTGICFAPTPRQSPSTLPRTKIPPHEYHCRHPAPRLGGTPPIQGQ